MFTLCATMLELVDLAVDQVLEEITDPSLVVYFKIVQVVESLLGMFAMLMVYFLIGRFRVFLPSISYELRHLGLSVKNFPTQRARNNGEADQGLQPRFCLESDLSGVIYVFSAALLFGPIFEV